VWPNVYARCASPASPPPCGTTQNWGKGGNSPSQRSGESKGVPTLPDSRECASTSSTGRAYDVPPIGSPPASGSCAIEHFPGRKMVATSPPSCLLSSFLHTPRRSPTVSPSDSHPNSHSRSHEVESTLRALTHPKLPVTAVSDADDSVNDDNVKEGEGQSGDKDGRRDGDDIASGPVYAMTDSSSSDAVLLMGPGSGGSSRKLWELPLIISN